MGVTRRLTRAIVAMYMRFVVPLFHDESRSFQGIFSAAGNLRDQQLLTDYEEEWLSDLLRWFGKNLPVPTPFLQRSRRKSNPRTICWIKNTAVEHVDRLHELSIILDQHGKPAKVLRTRRPGVVAYEDDFQVAALPYRDTFTRIV